MKAVLWFGSLLLLTGYLGATGAPSESEVQASSEHRAAAEQAVKQKTFLDYLLGRRIEKKPIASGR